ncbi:hypothetical protein FDK38_001021 [Candidozyma auris]|nr:hypothetical protein FDK38_001021 [[Candida] auris]
MISSSEKIFRDVVENTRLGQDKELVQLLKHNQESKSALHEEVERLIHELNLVEYKVAQQTGETIEDEKAFPKEGSSKALRKPFEDWDEGTERRLSNEIRNLTQGETSPQAIPGSLATAMISNIVVNSKVTNLENEEYTPVPNQKQRKGSIKETFKRYRARLQHPELAISHGQKGHSRTASSQTVKASRRSSLVGEVLPEYIRKQLTLESEPSASSEHQSPDRNQSISPNTRSNPSEGHFSDTLDATERRVSEGHSSRHTDNVNSSKRLHSWDSRRAADNNQASRFKNVLVNSQSLYVRKDDDSMNTSHDSYELGVSESDKEYISPSSFTRSIEDVQGHEMLFNRTDDEGEQEDEDDEDAEANDEDDGDYLFKT